MTRPVIALFGGTPDEREEWIPALQAEAAKARLALELRLPGEGDPAQIEAVIYNPEGPVDGFDAFAGLKAVLSMWAGVEKIVGDEGIRVPLCRMVEEGLTLGMRDWVVAHVMRRHVGLDRHLAMGPGDWPRDHPPLAKERRVTVLGLGELGAAAAQGLAGLGFQVTGWSRRAREVPGVRCLSGGAGLEEALRAAEFLVLLLPKTPATENLMDARRLGWLPRGAEIFNPGRGALIDDDALLAALDEGQVGHATLDVFRTEPLPADHPYRSHPRATVTPHVAAATRAGTASASIVANLIRLRDGAALEHVVDRAQGY